MIVMLATNRRQLSDWEGQPDLNIYVRRAAVSLSINRTKGKTASTFLSKCRPKQHK
jgi:hypothetical protein